MLLCLVVCLTLLASSSLIRTYTLYNVQYTLYITVYTRMYNVTLYITVYTCMYNVQYTLYITVYTCMYNVQTLQYIHVCTMYSIHCTLQYIHVCTMYRHYSIYMYAVYIVHYSIYMYVQCTVYTCMYIVHVYCSLGSRPPPFRARFIMRMRKRQTFKERDVCRLRMRIIKTRTERGRPGTEATVYMYNVQYKL